MDMSVTLVHLSRSCCPWVLVSWVLKAAQRICNLTRFSRCLSLVTVSQDHTGKQPFFHVSSWSPCLCLPECGREVVVAPFHSHAWGCTSTCSPRTRGPQCPSVQSLQDHRSFCYVSSKSGPEETKAKLKVKICWNGKYETLPGNRGKNRKAMTIEALI